MHIAESFFKEQLHQTQTWKAEKGRISQESSFFHHLYSNIILFSGASPTHALNMFSNIALCFDSAFTTGVPGGTCFSTTLKLL